MTRSSMRLILMLVVTALHSSPAAAADTKPLKVFILAGQSNMVGSGQSEELPEEYRTSPANVQVLARNGKLGPLQPRGRFGPEVSFSHAIAKAWPEEQIVIVKLAIGGTSALAWSPEWTEAGAKITQNERSGPLYRRLMELVKTLTDSRDTEIVAMLWAQGGRDGRYEAAAKDYQQNLTKIIAAVRRDLGNENLPFLLAQTVDAPPARFPHIGKVRADQQRVAEELPHTRLISSDGLAKHRDNVHFNTEGQLELGQRFAKAVLEMTATKEMP